MKRLILAVTACLLLAACGTATPYQPAVGKAGSGYKETRLTSDRFRVSFSGNSLTSRDTVERYLLFRAAELTLAEGHDWFSLVDRHTERDRRTYYTGPSWGYGYGYGYGYWRPHWAYYGYPGYGPWGPWGGGYWGGGAFDYQTVTRYEASAEIFLGPGPKPANDPAAFDAHEVVKNLGPSIVRPAA
jgi:hypothetical protein